MKSKTSFKKQKTDATAFSFNLHIIWDVCLRVSCKAIISTTHQEKARANLRDSRCLWRLCTQQAFYTIKDKRSVNCQHQLAQQLHAGSISSKTGWTIVFRSFKHFPYIRGQLRSDLGITNSRTLRITAGQRRWFHHPYEQIKKRKFSKRIIHCAETSVCPAAYKLYKFLFHKDGVKQLVALIQHKCRKCIRLKWMESYLHSSLCYRLSSHLHTGTGNYQGCWNIFVYIPPGIQGRNTHRCLSSHHSSVYQQPS